MNLSAHGVNKRWPNGRVAVENFSAEFAPGTITALIGRNGSGKTTVLRLLAGLLLPDSGTIRRTPGSIGFVFHQGALWPHLTIREQVTLTLRLVAKAADVASETDHFLAKLKLDKIADNYPAELSGGQQQRAAIARCLCVKPQVILMDEITSSLDPVAQDEIYRVIDELKSDLTIVASTHDLIWARDTCDRVIYMADGTIKGEGDWQKVVSDPEDPMFSALSKRGS